MKDVSSSSVPPPAILIVEDEIFVALDIERVLTDYGYPVGGIAMDREEALALANGCTLALVDINLRDGRTGPQIAADLYDKYAIRSVFVTANPAQIGAPPTGALGYVCKPFDGQMLRSAIEWALADGHSLPDNDAVVPLSRATGG
ncbi:response regulator [Sphingobium sufflavum]|uniref:response regulator n=1 Tax=Sphingobium sufflavum TaxID=1129547 RepID=UPI001F320464|nr:response regulator [Sphingobium sufflavum]MCE7795085.1 response regulator [Sphingobium sufflavum]